MKYYKVLGENGKPCNGGKGKYSLPTRMGDGTWKPGRWMPSIKGELEPCKNGYHLCRPGDLLKYVNPSDIEGVICPCGGVLDLRSIQGK